LSSRGRICSTARASRSQLVASAGATLTSWPSTVMPVRKSFFWKAASASRRKVAAGLITVPASVLIWASSLIAASSRSLRLKALSAASAGKMAKARSAAARPARTDVNIGGASQYGDGRLC
jgi:hypothetical protein